MTLLRVIVISQL